VGVDAQTLARVIYHEGGAYLNGTRSAAEFIDDNLGIHESVGIAQVKVSTARQIDRDVYGDTVMAAGTDEQVSDRLIYDLPYALRTAAGKLRLLMDQGITDRYGLVMTYNLTLDSARGWMEAGYSFDEATLEALDIYRDVQLRRAQELNEAVAALE
jgi:hypothetical protein